MGKKFKVGDRVIAIAPPAGLRYLVGRVGTVVVSNSMNIGVAFDEGFKDGHDCGGICENHHGRWCNGIEFELLIEDDSTELEEIEPIEKLLSVFGVNAL